VKRVLLGCVLLLAGCAPAPGDVPAEEPPHKVDFLVSAVGSANEDVKITYSAGGAGASGTATTPGAMPFWSESVTSDKGTTLVMLGAAGNSSDLKFALVCVITVDGVEVKRVKQAYACNAEFRLSDLPSAMANRPSPSLSTSPTPAPTSFAPPPAGCGFLTYDQVAEIVRRLSGVDKPVQTSGGTETSCTYVIDYESARVRVVWTPSTKATPFPGVTKEPGLPDAAYWMSYGTWGTLDVQRPKGVFSVTTTVGLLPLDGKKFAIDVYKSARPKLP
jgi:hypothetical protein